MRSVVILSGFEVLIISLTECSSGTTQKLAFVVNTMIELKNIAPLSHNTCTIVNGFIAHLMPLLLDVAVIFFSSIEELASNGQVLSCATIAFSERYVCFRFSILVLWLVHIVDTMQCLVNQYFLPNIM